MASPPKVFISAVSGDLRSVRQLVKEALLTIDCHPVEQTNFAPDWRTVGGMLRGKIEGCQALIHITGMRYGAEPDPATLPPGTARRSFTQMEYDIGRALQRERGDHGFRVYTFVCPPQFLYDSLGKEGAPLPVEDIALRGMQEQHRAALLADPHLYEQPPDSATIQTRVTALREEVLTLRREEAEVRREVQTTRRSGAWVAAAILLVLAGIVWGVAHLTHKTNTLDTGQKDISAHLELDRLTDRALTSYQNRFRHIREQSKDLPNATIDKMVRGELPGILKVDAATVATILDTEAPRLAAALDTPLDRKLSALFVMGEYQTVLDTGEKRLVDSGIPALRTMGDAARALFDKTPDKKHLEAALRYYSGAAALTDRTKVPLIWAENQFWAAWTLGDLARYAEAEPLLRAVAEILKRELGEKAPQFAIALNNLAQLVQATNRLAEAEPLYRRALAIDEACFGKESPEVATVLDNLAMLLQATNRLAEAELLYRRALAIDEASFGKEHPTIATALNNLAALRQATNRLSQAEPLMERVVHIFEVSYGKEHPNVATALNNLAQLRKATNRLAEAEPLMERALAIDEASFGKEHPNVAIRLNNLAGLLLATNRLAKAEPLYRRALAIDEASFGKEYPTVATALNNLAQLLKTTNRLSEAEPLMERVVHIFEVSYGKEHPNVATALNNLAQLLKTTNRLAEAEPLMKRALVIDETSFGKDHSKVATDLNNLANLLSDTNRLADAEPLSRRMVGIFLKFRAVTGHRHPNMMDDIRNYLIICNRLGLPPAEVIAHLKEQRSAAGLEPGVFAEIVREALTAK